MTYAKDTSVPVGRSQDQIRTILFKYGATGFVFGESQAHVAHGTITQGMVVFEMRERRIKFVVPLPKDRTSKAGAQSERSRWRCLLLAIKAKLESVASGIAVFEDEFLANIVMPDGSTVSQNVLPIIAQSYAEKRMLPLLGPGSGS